MCNIISQNFLSHHEGKERPTGQRTQPSYAHSLASGSLFPKIPNMIPKTFTINTESRSPPPHESMDGLWDLLAEEGLTDFSTTNARLILASKATLAIWAAMTMITLAVAPSEAYQHASTLERQVCSIAFCLLLMSNISRFMPLLYADRLVFQRRLGIKYMESGFLVAASTVQFVAMMACGLMAFFPTPVLIDPITQTRVYLVRWCEWAPLGFLLTFLSEEIDVPTPANRRKSLRHGILQGCIVLTGFVFPFVTNPKIWWSIVSVDVTCFCYLFIRIFQKGARLETLRRNEMSRSLLRNSGEASEAYDRCRLSHRSLLECAVSWSLLVVLHFAASFVPHYINVQQYGVDPLTLPMLAETFCEVLSKHLHILVVEQVFQSFSSGARSRRVLDQLRRVMSIFWERASDALVLCLTTKNTRICLASPTFLGFMALDEKKANKALLFELPHDEDDNSSTLEASLLGCTSRVKNAYIVDMDDIPTSNLEWKQGSVTVLPQEKNYFVESVGDLIADSTADGPTSGHHIHVFEHPDGNKLHCETSVTMMEAGSALVVLRDISDRIHRFEAEKKLAVETTEREKDSQTNRFTRHEVKNGLLAGIHLCDTMKENLKHAADGSSFGKSNSSNGQQVRLLGSGNVQESLVELESTLHEVLDTVLSEAMSRDVVHEAYVPREEAVDVAQIVGTARLKARRFPLLIGSSKLPQFLLDKQLLRYVHRNAVSNACKYGKRGGLVSTVVKYDLDMKLLNVEIINEPGPHHEVLMTMGEEASKGVFEAGRQLHDTWKSKDVDGHHREASASVSSGDGAWIMRKCARIMGGDCSITFNPERTIFKLTIPAKPVIDPAHQGNGKNKPTFSIPPKTWGVIVDDSKVQRKLLAHMLSLIGIRPDRRVVLGATVDEVQNFHHDVKRILQENPTDKVLVIADENLDFVDGSVSQHHTISGSLCVEQLLKLLNREQGSRLLAVVRSANDSSADVATYEKRTHGFMPKEPIRKDGVLEMIRPLWERRFPKLDTLPEMTGNSDLPRSVSTESQASKNCNNSCTGTPAVASTSSADLIQAVETLDNLIISSAVNSQWAQIRERFLKLKGDMMTLTDRSAPRVTAVIEALGDLGSLEVEGPPVDIQSRWKLIRALIVSLV